jgi:RNA-binding protein YhbY
MADHTERAREIVRKYIKLGVKFVVGKYVYAEWMKDDIEAALTAAERAGAEKMRAHCLEVVRAVLADSILQNAIYADIERALAARDAAQGE